MSETIPCPYCAEQIQDAARKCRHCGEWLEKTTEDPRPRSTPTAQPGKPRPNYLIAAAIIIVGSLILLGNDPETFGSAWRGYSDMSRALGVGPLGLPVLAIIALMVASAAVRRVRRRRRLP